MWRGEPDEGATVTPADSDDRRRDSAPQRDAARKSRLTRHTNKAYILKRRRRRIIISSRTMMIHTNSPILRQHFSNVPTTSPPAIEPPSCPGGCRISFNVAALSNSSLVNGDPLYVPPSANTLNR